MKKIGLLLAAVSLLLVACSEEEGPLKENDYTVKDIRFEKTEGFFNTSHIYIDTEQETFVINPWGWRTKFVKTKEPTTINIKLIDGEGFLGESTEETTIYVNEKEVSEISKEYASEFKTTLEFADKEDR